MQESTASPIEVFVFCRYPECSYPRAIIVDYSKCTEEIKSDIQFLTQHGSLLENMYNIENMSEGVRKQILTGYRSNDIIYENNNLSCSSCFQRLRDIVSNWTYYADHLHAELYEEDFDKDHWINNAFEYYINDEHGNLRPKKLLEVLSGMSTLPLSKIGNSTDEEMIEPSATIFNSKIVVKYCVLVSDVPISDDEKKPSLFK
jgi:hypothetical protein